MDCCGVRHGCWFKLSVLGVMFSLVMALLGVVPPFKHLLVPFPLPWILAVFALIPSLVLYYSVKEKFWAEVMEAKEGRRGPSA